MGAFASPALGKRPCFCSSSSPPPFLHLPCDLFQGFTPDKLPPSSCMMVPELHPPSPAKKFFTKMAKSLFGKKKSKGERPSDDTRYVQDSHSAPLLPDAVYSLPPPLNSSASLLVSQWRRFRARKRRKRTFPNWFPELSNVRLTDGSATRPWGPTRYVLACSSGSPIEALNGVKQEEG